VEGLSVAHVCEVILSAPHDQPSLTSLLEEVIEIVAIPCRLQELCLDLGTQLVHQTSEEAVLYGEKLMKRAIFRHLTRTHHHNPIVVSDGLQAMGNGEDGTVIELRSYCGLNLLVGERID
jgi:hypothetical protein